MSNWGLIAVKQGNKYPFIFCMTETEERANALKEHYKIEKPGYVFSVSPIPEDARTGDYYKEVPA